SDLELDIDPCGLPYLHWDRRPLGPLEASGARLYAIRSDHQERNRISAGLACVCRRLDARGFVGDGHLNVRHDPARRVGMMPVIVPRSPWANRVAAIRKNDSLID